MKFRKITTIFVLLALLSPLFSHAAKIGWVTDIHAGSAKKKRKARPIFSTPVIISNI